ncbi:MAG: TA system VapC family ribonuclease toxin [Candidatus Binatia bacterium]
MIAADANVLVYAHRADSEWHDRASSQLAALAEGRAPWPCVHEFLAIVTHPRIYDPPTPVAGALAQVDAWLESPTLVLLAEGQEHWQQLRGLLAGARILGPRVHDARIAALCLGHGVRELWTVDRDFGRFPALTVVDPLVD